MPLKIQAASIEEHAFAAEVNKRLASTGAKVNACTFVLTEGDSETRWYALTFQHGPKRETEQADTPWHYESPETVVDRVKRWLAGNGANNLYSPDPKYAE